MAASRAIIIGAAPVLTRGPFQEPSTPRALARFIDDCDVVVRMNNLKNFGAPGFGTKTDIHVVTNTGKPGRRYARKARLDAKVLRGTREVWFSSDPSLIESGELMRERNPDPDASKDWAPQILAFQGWQARDWRYLDVDVPRRLKAELEELGGVNVDPSAGLRVIAAILRDDRFSAHQLHVLGFGFAGSNAHAWDAERAWVEARVSEGRIARVPGAPGGESFPHDAAARRGARLSWWTHLRTRCRLRGRRIWPLNP